MKDGNHNINHGYALTYLFKQCPIAVQSLFVCIHSSLDRFSEQYPDAGRDPNWNAPFDPFEGGSSSNGLVISNPLFSAGAIVNPAASLAAPPLTISTFGQVVTIQI